MPKEIRTLGEMVEVIAEEQGNFETGVIGSSWKAIKFSGQVDNLVILHSDCGTIIHICSEEPREAVVSDSIGDFVASFGEIDNDVELDDGPITVEIVEL